MKKVAIVVLHFGNFRDTLTCLKTLENITYKPVTIYIVDNGTGKIDQRSFREFSQRIIVLKNETNLGYAGGNNTGITKALKDKNDFVLLLNNDATAHPSVIEELLLPFKDASIGITGCIITYAKSERIWFAGGLLHKNLCITRHPHMNEDFSKVSVNSGEVDFITGAAMMIRSKTLGKVGKIPEDYFLYWEDVDFCFQAKKLDYRSFLVNKPLIQHSVSASSGVKGTNKLSELRAYYYARNPFIFMKKNKLNKISGTVGRILIFPYFIFQTDSPKAMISYIKGCIEGISLLFHYSK